jgi:hypothetical protein
MHGQYGHSNWIRNLLNLHIFVSISTHTDRARTLCSALSVPQITNLGRNCGHSNIRSFSCCQGARQDAL